MNELADLKVWWFPAVVWLVTVGLVVWNGFLLGRYRRDGRLPVKSMQRDVDLMLGRYDHLPGLRSVRRACLISMGVFCAAVVVVLATK